MYRLLMVVLLLYVVFYGLFRSMSSEVWIEDGNTYVIYPESPIAVYYIFRPLSYLDGFLTGTGSHIGPHQ
ncbi:MAG: hypothetical protein ABJD13_05355 [Paracoccaceae bacterium]